MPLPWLPFPTLTEDSEHYTPYEDAVGQDTAEHVELIPSQQAKAKKVNSIRPAAKRKALSSTGSSSSENTSVCIL